MVGIHPGGSSGGVDRGTLGRCTHVGSLRFCHIMTNRNKFRAICMSFGPEMTNNGTFSTYHLPSGTCGCTLQLHSCLRSPLTSLAGLLPPPLYRPLASSVPSSSPPSTPPLTPIYCCPFPPSYISLFIPSTQLPLATYSTAPLLLRVFPSSEPIF